MSDRAPPTNHPVHAPDPVAVWPHGTVGAIPAAPGAAFLVATRPPTDAADPAVAPATVMALQRAVGNRVVLRWFGDPDEAANQSDPDAIHTDPDVDLGPDAATDPGPASATATAGGPDIDPAATDAFFSRSELEAARDRATARYAMLTLCVDTGTAVVDLLRATLQTLSATYAEAHASFAGVLAEAEIGARDEQDWWDAAVGVVVGSVIGAVSEKMIPEGASDKVEIAVEIIVEAIEGVLTVGAKEATKAAGLTVSGTDLAPGRGPHNLDQHLLESQSWQTVEGWYRDILGIGRLGPALFRFTSAAQHAIGEIKVHGAGGVAETSEADLLAQVEGLLAADAAAADLDELLAATLAGFTVAIPQVALIRQPSTEDMERDIWIMWLSTVYEDESDLLDRDPIENRLLELKLIGPGGLLGADFGAWTSERDELDALEIAHNKAVLIRGRYDTATGGNPAPGGG